MASQRMSRTATGAAWCRMVEQEQPQALRVFNDPVVGRLVDPLLAAMARGPMRQSLMDAAGPGTYGSIVMRTRYIDDVVTEFTRGGVTQLVLLGAGLDTRAYRLPGLDATTVFDVDLPEIQAHKGKALRGVKPTAREVRFVPVDLTAQPLAATLAAAGWDPARPSLFVWEGVTQYLTADAVHATLSCVGASASGGAIVFTFVPREVVAAGGPWAGGDLGTMAAAEPWRFGIDPSHLADLLAGFGLTLIDEVGADDYRARYLTPLGRQLDVGDVERAALALVDGLPAS